MIADLIGKLQHSLPLARQIVCKARRRVLEGESVFAQEKIVSIFELKFPVLKNGRPEV